MPFQVCLWNQCSLNISELPHHLSRDHIGWKREEYNCLWDNCHRKNIRWYSRFSFISHLRLHTGESPFECLFCHKTFSNMEGLERHGKLEHHTNTEQILKKVPASIKKKRKLAELEQRYNDYLSDDSDVQDQVDLPQLLHEHAHKHNNELLIPKLTTKRKQKKTTTTGEEGEKESIKDQYKLAKAQLNYILRENEMLVDEWTSTEKKLKRLRTERRVLLDALVRRGYNNEEIE